MADIATDARRERHASAVIAGCARRSRAPRARPRLAVFRSNKHLVAQVIDDDAGRTVAAASTAEPELRAASGSTVEAAGKVGTLLAGRAKAAGITKVVFDRGGFIYHGRIAAVAAAAREAGLEF